MRTVFLCEQTEYLLDDRQCMIHQHPVVRVLTSQRCLAWASREQSSLTMCTWISHTGLTVSQNQRQAVNKTANSQGRFFPTYFLCWMSIIRWNEEYRIINYLSAAEYQPYAAAYSIPGVHNTMRMQRHTQYQTYAAGYAIPDVCSGVCNTRRIHRRSQYQKYAAVYEVLVVCNAVFLRSAE